MGFRPIDEEPRNYCLAPIYPRCTRLKMPRHRPRKREGKKNNNKRKDFSAGRPAKLEEMESSSSLDESDDVELEKEMVLRARPLEAPHPWEPDDNINKKRTKSLKRTRNQLDMPSNEPIAIEMKWSVVMRFRVEEALGNMTNELADEIGSDINISGSRLRILAKQANEEGSLLRKPGSGAAPLEESEDILEFVNEQAKVRKFHFSYKFMAGLVQKEFDVGSASTIWRKLKENDWRDIKKKTRTFLTPKHVAFRLQWCQERMNIKYDETVGGVYRCDTDEKLFIAMKNGTVLHVPPEVREVVEEVLSKTQPTRLMVLAVIGPPIPSKGFDGKVSIVPIMGIKTALMNSKYHIKGDEYEVPITMDGELFQSIIKNNVIPDMISVLPKFIKKVELQCDSAGGHGNIKKTIEILNEFGSKTTKRRWFKFALDAQPTRSPESNGLDLGGWASLDSMVECVSYHPNPDKPRVEMLRDNVFHAWEQWDGFDVLDRLFKTKTRVIRAIVEHEGRNDFPMPHSKNKRT